MFGASCPLSFANFTAEAAISIFFSLAKPEHMCAQLPPVGPMTRTDALDAGAARKEAYEEAA